MRVLALLLLLTTSSLPAAQSHFLKDITIADQEIVDGDLSVYRGDLRVAGTVTGNVAVIFGDCQLEESALIEGDLVVMQGRLELVHPDQVRGRISHRELGVSGSSGSSDPFMSDAGRTQGGESSKGGKRIEVDDDDSDVYFSFNRVAGLQLGVSFNSERARMSRDKLFDLAGYAAWAFGEKRPEWNLMLRKRLFDDPNVYLGVGIQRMTDTQDRWMISDMENSLAGWALKQDFRDYFDNKGGQAELGAFFLDGDLQLSAGWFREEYGAMEKTTEWNWSPIDRPYRENLYHAATVDSSGIVTDVGFQEGNNQGIRLKGDFRTPAGRHKPGLDLTLQYEQNFKSDEDPWDYSRYLGNLRFRLPIGKHHLEQFSGRILAGTIDGKAPDQYYFRLGGPDALPGYRPKSIDGYRDNLDEDRIENSLYHPDSGVRLGASNMVLISLENRIAGSALQFWPLDDIDLLLMADAGCIFEGGWGDLEADDFKADVGFGLADSDEDSWSLGLFRSTESGNADWRLMLRLSQRF